MKILLSLPVLLTLFSCGQSKDPGIKKQIPDSSGLVDYKMSAYKLFMGQDKDSIRKIFDFSSDYLRNDGIINDTGITHYMAFGEDVMQINNTDFLPALFFTADHRKMVEFNCSIIASPESLSLADVMKFLIAIEPLFRNLRSAENKSELATSYKLNIDTTNSIEYFTLDTTSRNSDIVFNYVKKVKAPR